MHHHRDGGVEGCFVGIQQVDPHVVHAPTLRGTVTGMDEHGQQVSLPLMGDVQLPPLHHLVWYGGVAALVAFECLEWPVALLLATGKALADNRHSALLREFGEALEEAG